MIIGLINYYNDMWIDGVHQAEVFEVNETSLRENRRIVKAYLYDLEGTKREGHVATLYYNEEKEEVPEIGDMVEVEFETGGWVRVK